MRPLSIAAGLVLMATFIISPPPSARAASAGAFPAKGDTATATKRTLNFRGAPRTYLVQPVAGPGPFPLVIVLHGATVTAERTWRQTSLPILGAAQKFIVVAPQGVDNRWDESSGPGPDNDVEFLRAVMREEIAKDHADPKAVFMVGMSNGGFMTIHFVCMGGAELRAAGSVSATLSEDEVAGCAPKKALPWIEMHGDADMIVPFDAGEGLLSAEQTFAFFADKAGCAKAVAREQLADVTADDGSTAEKRVRSGCAGGKATSTFYVLHGAGHSWPNSQSGPPGPRGAVNQDIDGGSVVWDHFRATLAGR
jgi:polyhydroxybutyrate depolymerase